MTKKMKSYRLDEVTQNYLNKILEQYNYKTETEILTQAIKDIAERLLTDDELKSCQRVDRR